MNRILQQLPVLLISLSLLVLASATSGCKFYEEGPGLSFTGRASRVENTWKVASFSRNNINITLQYDYQYVTFDKGGSYTLTTLDAVAGSKPDEVKATWLLVTADKQIQLKFADDTVVGQSLLYMDILRLTNKEMKLSYILNGDDYVMVLGPK